MEPLFAGYWSTTHYSPERGVIVEAATVDVKAMSGGASSEPVLMRKPSYSTPIAGPSSCTGVSPKTPISFAGLRWAVVMLKGVSRIHRPGTKRCRQRSEGEKGGKRGADWNTTQSAAMGTQGAKRPDAKAQTRFPERRADDLFGAMGALGSIVCFNRVSMTMGIARFRIAGCKTGASTVVQPRFLFKLTVLVV